MRGQSRKRIQSSCAVLLLWGMAVLGGNFEAPAQIARPTAQDVQTQTTTKQETPVQAKPLRATTRLVELSVIVRDKHDQLIRGLTKSDFEVLDNGARQDIQIFSVTTNEPPSRLPAALSPNTYTNRMPGIGDAPSNITVLLLDALNTPLSDQAFASRAPGEIPRSAATARSDCYLQSHSATEDAARLYERRRVVVDRRAEGLQRTAF